MAIRLYETKMEFDYDSSDGTVKTTHTVYIESDGLYFNGTIYGTGAPGVFVDSTVSSDSSGLSTGDFEFQPNQIAFGTNTLYAKADGSGVVFSGTIGATLDSVEAPAPPPAQGTVAGFTTGGFDGTPTPFNQIEKFPFSISGGTATDVGDLLTTNRNAGSESSSTDGFTLGGQTPTFVSTIGKFPFAISGGTETDVGDLSQVRILARGHVSTSDVFASGGTAPPQVTTIDKFPFNISSGTATDVGDLSLAKYGHTSVGHSSSTDGFASGGLTTPPITRRSEIDKFPFSISSGTATDVGDLSVARSGSGGHSSTTDGFASGGASPSTISQIDKFPFSISSGTTTDVGDLSATREVMAGHSTTTDAFVSGGYITTSPYRASGIDKFPFSISSGTATDVGDLSLARSNVMGNQD